MRTTSKEVNPLTYDNLLFIWLKIRSLNIHKGTEFFLME